MKNLKKLLAIVIAVALLLCSVPMIASAVSVPAMNNEKQYALYSQEGQFISRTYTRGQSTYDFGIGGWDGVFYYEFPTENASGTINVSDAEALEFDMYASAAMPDTILIVTSGSGDGPGRRGVKFPALNEGWNHICIPMTDIGNAEGNYDRDIVYDTASLNAFYVFNTDVQPVDPEVESVDFIMANLAFTADIVVPKLTVVNGVALETKEGVFWAKDGIAANYTMPPFGPDNNPSWYGHLNQSYNTTNAEYLEMDIYSNVAVPDIKVWVSSAAWADAGRARMETGFKLNAGWTHIIVDMSKLSVISTAPNADFNRAAVKNIFL